MKMTTLNPAIRAFLERDRIATLNILGILQNEPGVELLVDDEEPPHGVLVKGPWFWYLHTVDELFLEAFVLDLEQHAGFYRFSGVWRPLAEKLKARFQVVWEAPCDLYHFPPEHRQPGLATQLARSLDLRDAEIIDQHYAYRHSGSLEQIRNCIQHRNSSAIYVDGRIVCWVLVHEDDSLGIMYTLEDHRRKGYGVDVTVDLVGKQLAEGRTPFLQIRNDNSLSPGLARKCGFVKHGSCDWFGIAVGTPPEVIEGGRALRRRVLEGMGNSGRSQREGEVACLYRFLHLLEPLPSEDNPVVETVDEAEWLGCAAQYFDGELLKAILASFGKDGRLLCERQEGTIRAVAALLVDEHESCELLWCSSGEERFLWQILWRAKTMGLDAAFLHVPPEEQPAFEGLGFRKAYTERDTS